MSDKPRLTAVPGGRTDTAPRAGRRRALDQDEQVMCWRCEVDTGVATSCVTLTIVAPRRSPKGKLSGGTPQWVCAHCLARGLVTVLLKS